MVATYYFPVKYPNLESSVKSTLYRSTPHVFTVTRMDNKQEGWYDRLIVVRVDRLKLPVQCQCLRYWSS